MDRDIRNTPFFNILCANPSVAIFYADFFRRHGANPSLIKDLEVRSGFFSDPDQSTKLNPRKGPDPMSLNKNSRICTHIKVNGTRCGSPALREEVFCYFHQRMIRGVRTPPKSRLHPIALIEDESSIQASLMEIINAVVRNQIDVARARVVLRALHIAVRNSKAASFDVFRNNVVDEVPQYPAAPAAAGPLSLAFAQAAALAQINTPPEEESEEERLDSYFAVPLDLPERKPPASVKQAARPRSVRPIRVGAHASRSHPYQESPA
jgi:hypothetical protein